MGVPLLSTCTNRIQRRIWTGASFFRASNRITAIIIQVHKSIINV
jgi:hypothetical protein